MVIKELSYFNLLMDAPQRPSVLRTVLRTAQPASTPCPKGEPA